MEVIVHYIQGQLWMNEHFYFSSTIYLISDMFHFSNSGAKSIVHKLQAKNGDKISEIHEDKIWKSQMLIQKEKTPRKMAGWERENKHAPDFNAGSSAKLIARNNWMIWGPKLLPYLALKD